MSCGAPLVWLLTTAGRVVWCPAGVAADHSRDVCAGDRLLPRPDGGARRPEDRVDRRQRHAGDAAGERGAGGASGAGGRRRGRERVSRGPRGAHRLPRRRASLPRHAQQGQELADVHHRPAAALPQQVSRVGGRMRTHAYMYADARVL